MPGRTPQAAVTAFMQPLKEALSTLSGHGQITIDRRGGYTRGRTYHWELNGGHGMSWPGVGSFSASMDFVIVDAVPEKHGGRSGDLTVSTRGYCYNFTGPNGSTARWRIHWHPNGKSSHVDPHLHVPPDIKKTLPSSRASFEQAVRWCLVEGVPPSFSDQKVNDLLIKSESGFRLYCSWHDITEPAYLELRESLTAE